MAYVEGLVSVVIPSYNRLEYIKKAISSVLSQDYSRIELIVVDDGSSDGSYDLLLTYADQGSLTLASHAGRANKGQSAAINLGLQQASGEYIVILDSDDFLTNGSISRHVLFLQRHPNVGMVYGSGEAVDSEGRPLGFKTLALSHTEPSDPNRLLLDCYVALPGAAMVRKQVYDKVGLFEESLRAGQDHDMALRIFEVTIVAYVPEVAFCYRKHRDSISTNGLEKRWRNGFDILYRAKSRYPYKRSTIRRRTATLNFRLAETYFNQGRYWLAIPHLVKAGILDPVRSIRVLTKREKLR